MGATKRVLFEKCPLCRKGRIEMTVGSVLVGPDPVINPCPACGAIFAQNGNGRYRLGYCDPRKLASITGKKYPSSVCNDCVPLIECWLGRTLSKSQWDDLAEGKDVETWAAYEDLRGELEADTFALGSSELGLVPLDDDEVVHHSSMIQLGEMVGHGGLQEEAQLLLTSRRILIVHQSMLYDIRLADIEKVEQSFPGFVIKARSVGFPLYCFPVPGDPVYQAIIGALKKIH